jgi:uncharacterized protein
MTGFAQRYGPWAVVAGASEGIGAAFATALATRGVRPVLVARRPEPLTALAAALPVDAVTLATDLSTVDGLRAVFDATEGIEVGLVVCNAAYAPVARLADLDPTEATRALDLNCRAPLALAQRYLPAMADRGRGGFVVMSSLAGNQGSPGLSVYAATKAFGTVLAEGLWGELRGSGVDVLACTAGAVATPGLGRVASRPAPGTVSPAAVAEAALDALGKGPRTVPGTLMKLATPVLNRLPRRMMIGMMGRAAGGLAAPGATP